MVMHPESHGLCLVRSFQLVSVLREGERWGLLDRAGNSNRPYEGARFDLIRAVVDRMVTLSD